MSHAALRAGVHPMFDGLLRSRLSFAHVSLLALALSAKERPSNIDSREGAFGRLMVLYEREKRKVNDHQPSLHFLEVDGQWLTFPFPFVHHQPLRGSIF